MYKGRLGDWTRELERSRGLILAISRKGPRLLELLVREGLLPSTFMGRVICEQALPFLQDCPDDLIVIDDALNYGSTFSKVISLARQVYEKCKGGGDVIGLPFAISSEASEEYRLTVSKYFLDLKADEIASFVNNQVSAFHLLGKPFDIEHPLLTLSGDFSDFTRVEAALRQIAWRLDSELIPLTYDVPTVGGVFKSRTWTVLLQKCSAVTGSHLGFGKLRFYVNPESTQISLVSMRPFAMSQKNMARLAEELPSPLNELWRLAAQSIYDAPLPALEIASQRSLSMWANFLFEVLLLNAVKDTVLDELSLEGLDVIAAGPRENDIRLIVGPQLARRAESELDDFFRKKTLTSDYFELNPEPTLNGVAEEKIPEQYKAGYEKELTGLLAPARDVDDVLGAVFYAQHRAIELASRTTQEKADGRLEFGVTYQKLRRLVQRIVPDASDAAIHRGFDRLIDTGCIVPRYINMADQSAPVWVRAFRVGEGTTTIAAQAVRLLFETLSGQLGTSELPPLLLEKFCVLALDVATDKNVALAPMSTPEITKGFHLYGARCVITTGQHQEFLLNWAVEHGVLIGPSTEHLSETRGQYQLDPNVEGLYPEKECPWDEDTKEALQDLAALVKEIHGAPGLKNQALIALTSVATRREFHKAVAAELDLWLHDPRYSVYDGLKILGRLAARINDSRPIASGDKELKEANASLVHTARFTAQVYEKTELAEKKADIYRQIGEVAGRDALTKRVWRKLQASLESRAQPENYSPGRDEVLSALRIAYRTNGMLRDLLGSAGYTDALNRAKPLEESLNLLRQLLGDPHQVDQVTRSMFEATAQRPSVDSLIGEALVHLPGSFPEAFSYLRPVIIEIAARCEEVLRLYGGEEYQERFLLLEPPRFIVMWDIRGSSEVENRDQLEPLITKANRQILGTLRDNALDFRAESKDDGNGLICSRFSQVLTVFQILTEVFHDRSFRAGCEVNLQGRLNYYPESKSLGGRAFEHAARIAAMFKELKSDPAHWSNASSPSEPDSSYLIVGEFARRYAEREREWNVSAYEVEEPDGQFEARVRGALPISVTILTPRTS
jgi:hypothetical protein